jgi:anti-anti-sigma factor
MRLITAMQTQLSNSMEDLRFGNNSNKSNIHLSHYRCHNALILVVRLQGQLDATNATEIRNLIADQVIEKPPLVLFDMKEVVMMDSTGIGALAMAFNLTKFFGGKVAVCAIQKQPKMVFEITNMDKILHIYATRAEFEAAIPTLLAA